MCVLKKPLAGIPRVREPSFYKKNCREHFIRSIRILYVKVYWTIHFLGYRQFIKNVLQDVIFEYINGRDVQRKNVVNNVDKSSLWACYI